MNVSVLAIPATNPALQRGGDARATAALGARIFLHGPAKTAGNVKIITAITGSYTDFATNYINGDSESIYVETCEQVPEPTPYLPGCRNPADGVVFNASSGAPADFYCTNCGISNNRPVPSVTTTTISFIAGQGWVDFQAWLYAQAQGYRTFVSQKHLVRFKLVLPPGFTATSVLPFG